MSIKYSLKTIFDSIHKDTTGKLQISRETAGHPGDMGDASEENWISLFNEYLPQRYRAIKCHVIDSQNNVSEQIDVAVVDRQYTPFIWNFSGRKVVPVESIYAIFEAKQELNKAHIKYAHKKIASVRKLHKTSLSIPHAGRTPYDPKPNLPIIGGILALSSAYAPFCTDATENALMLRTHDQRINLACVADAGWLKLNEQVEGYEINPSKAPVTQFLFELIAMLQELGTVPMIDVRAYAAWIDSQ